MRRHLVLRLPRDRWLSSFILLHLATPCSAQDLPVGPAARNTATAGTALEQRVAPARRTKGANGCAHAHPGSPFSPVAASSSPSRVGWWPKCPPGVVCSCSVQHLLARLFYRSAIILHHAPGPSGLLHRLTYCTACLPARRVHVEPRPPDIEESSEFSRAPTGKDGIRQGRNVPSPPPPQPEARAYYATVLSTCSLLALDQRVWEQPSASTKLYAPKSVLLEGQLLSNPGWPLMADCGLERDTWWSGVD
jgi:hypothetical protein